MEKLSDIGEITYQQTVPAKQPVMVPVPEWIPLNVRERLQSRGISFLYLHQKQAMESISNRNNIVISTGTASGKSLCYQVPLLDMLMNEPEATAILIFPTKALTQDQFKSLREFIPEELGHIFIYDGDTPRQQRSLIRAQARVLFTNPDMLHMGILPYHPGWVRFFENLRYIIIDEVHSYKGIFGSHTANLFRRVKRVAAHYGASPQFVLCSATLSNAEEHANKLIGEPVEGFCDDFSGNGKREIVFLNPPIVNEDFQIRAGAVGTSAKTAKRLLETNRQMLLFCQSRMTVESTLRRLRDYGVDAEGYRSGYLPQERREVESGLKTGGTRCVAATNALELGMDIGGIDAVLSIGYPGSVAAYLQRQGRAGRAHGDSSFILVGSQTPTDQYILFHPDFLENRPCEPVMIDPDNLMIVLQHLQCALYELPFDRGDSYGNLSMEETQDLLDYLVSIGAARLSGQRYFWIASNGPQAEVSLRNAGMDRIAITCDDLGKPKLIGEVDRSSAYWMVHQGAVYYHNGTSYLIRDLDLITNVASARRCQLPYHTEATKNTRVTVNNVLSETEISGGSILTADVTVHTQVTGYKKVDNDNGRILGTETLDLPEETLDTNAFVLVLSEELVGKLKALALWNSDRNDYGPHWPQIRQSILERDHFTCQICHVTGEESMLHVHHIIPFRTFMRKDEANDPANLITLCPVCHRRAEEKLRIHSGLAGYAYAFHQIAALLLECDPGDLCIVTEIECPEFDGRPVFYLHETVPGGIGLSQAIVKAFEAVNNAVFDLISGCGCTDGCPGCIGASGENAVGDKAEVLTLCSELRGTPHE